MYDQINSILNIIVSCLIIVLFLLLIVHLYRKLNKKDKFNIKRLSQYVHAPLKCNSVPYRPGCCNLADCRQPGSQIDQYGNLQVYINPLDAMNFNKPIGYYGETKNPSGYEDNTSVNEFHTF